MDDVWRTQCSLVTGIPDPPMRFARPFVGRVIPFEGGPMDGQQFVYNPPFREHVYWRNKSGLHEVYMLHETDRGLVYKHVPDAVVGHEPPSAY